MQLLIIALVVILLALSWKYIQRLEPAGVFAAIWIISIPLVLLLQDYIILRYEGILYIVFAVTSFVLGTIFCDNYYHPKPTNVELTFQSKWVQPILIILFVGAMVNPIYSIVLHGFSLQALLDMREVLEMNKGMSEDRYSGAENSNIVNQFFLIFSYLAPLVGGFCYRMVGKITKALCFITLIPVTFIALTQSVKMGMITGFILWFSGYFVCSFSYGLQLEIKRKTIIYTLLGFTAFAGILFVSMVFRTGEISERTIVDISKKFITYALGHFHCFDMWYTTYEPTSNCWGTKTFLGISNVIGLEERTQGIYTEYYQIGQNGYYGISNVFTIFRLLAEDFGETGAILVLFIFGNLACLSLKCLKCKNHIITNQIVISATYAYLMWSFVASLFAYTSLIAMFVLAFFVFKIIQKETATC